MNKNKLILGGVIATIAFTASVFAQTTPTTPTTIPSREMIVQVGGAGKVLLRGTIDAVSATSITVKSWGGEWTVNVPTSAQVLPQGVALSSFQQGDYVGVQGTANTSSGWTVDATLVRDWTARQAMTAESKQNMQEVRQEKQANTPRTLEGTLSNLSGQTFTLTTSKGVSYTVTLASNAKILKKNYLTVDLSQVNSGDMVRVWGPVSSSTVMASIFRDVTITK